MEQATFAAGCFWGVEERFRTTRGVLRTVVGYAGGTVQNPTYEQVCSGKTGNAEAVHMEFDPQIISYDQLLLIFFANHDPTTPNRQGPDRGTQYRSVIFYHTHEQKEKAERCIRTLAASGKYHRMIVTELVPATNFYPAEEYHQKYLFKKGESSCSR